MERPCTNCHNSLINTIEDFVFTDLRHARPPAEKGVYLIRVKKRGNAPEQALSNLQIVTDKINWGIVTNYVHSRLNRVKRIRECDIIYIGRAGKSKNGNNTLKGRYEELANRHTIQFPLWFLLFLGWELEYGWCVSTSPENLEKELKALYRSCHNQNLPPLVNR